MPGIFGTNIKNNKKIMSSENRIYKNLSSDSFYLELSGIKKFENDKGLFENDSYILLLDGVILNLSSLKKKYKKDDLFNTIIAMYNEKEEFFNDLRGCFCGFFKDKKKDVTYIFTNHFGDKTIFYYLSDSNIIFASEIKDIIKLMDYSDIKHNVDKAAIYSMLTYGYMYNDITPISEIKRLIPGCYILIKNNTVEVKEYYHISNKVIDSDDEETIIKEIDRRFRNAMKLQIDKNMEYGYNNYAPLSAGLDSRMTNYVLRDLFDGDIYNMTYSETGQLDESVPAKISKELKTHWLFKNLDNGLALLDIVDSFKYTDGIIYYAWPSQLNDYMKLINTNNIGLVHTGVIGDVIVGTFFKDGIVTDYKLGDGAFSNKLIKKLSSQIAEKKYDNKEIGMYYNRACNGAILGYSMTFQYYTECMSPFMDVDFVNYCLSIPLKYRFQHNIYYKWVNKCYPEAAKYSHNGIKIPNSNTLRIPYKNKSYPIDTIYSRIKAVLNAKFNKSASMNPMDYWYESNAMLRNTMDNYYNDNIDIVSDKEVKKDMIDLYKSGNASEKIQVITALSIYVNSVRGKSV